MPVGAVEDDLGLTPGTVSTMMRHLSDQGLVDYVPRKTGGEERRDLLADLSEERREIDDMREVVGERFGPEFAAVFYTQMQILQDIARRYLLNPLQYR